MREGEDTGFKLERNQWYTFDLFYSQWMEVWFMVSTTRRVSRASSDFNFLGTLSELDCILQWRFRRPSASGLATILDLHYGLSILHTYPTLRWGLPHTTPHSPQIIWVHITFFLLLLVYQKQTG
ncbi:hypothetical protein F5B19DRAFT_93819 [Rostrohypoxylon terebratum]|nr:hypothetical protein F5B19DRAFT_93819 [Rostrohypoxylon terebratum]